MSNISIDSEIESSAEAVIPSTPTRLAVLLHAAAGKLHTKVDGLEKNATRGLRYQSRNEADSPLVPFGPENISEMLERGLIRRRGAQNSPDVAQYHGKRCHAYELTAHGRQVMAAWCDEWMGAANRIEATALKDAMARLELDSGALKASPRAGAEVRGARTVAVSSEPAF